MNPTFDKGRPVASATLALALASFSPATSQDGATSPEQIHHTGERFLTAIDRGNLSDGEFHRACNEVAKIGSAGDAFISQAAEHLAREATGEAGSREHTTLMNQKERLLLGLRYIHTYKDTESKTYPAHLTTSPSKRKIALAARDTVYDEGSTPLVVAKAARVIVWTGEVDVDPSYLSAPLSDLITSQAAREETDKEQEEQLRREIMVEAIIAVGGLGHYPNIGLLPDLIEHERNPKIAAQAAKSFAQLVARMPQKVLEKKPELLKQHCQLLHDRLEQLSVKNDDDVIILEGVLQAFGTIGKPAANEIPTICEALVQLVQEKPNGYENCARIGITSIAGICRDPRAEEPMKLAVQELTKVKKKASGRVASDISRMLAALETRLEAISAKE
ncbi:hypothetical protein MRY87_06550 [bacterium]|nr:hypothetical protein [bacterium]